MHRLRFVLKHDKNVLLKHLSDNVESLSTSFKLNPKIGRTLCTQNSDNADDTQNPGNEKKTSKPGSSEVNNNRSKEAKAKLENLLKSLVEDKNKTTRKGDGAGATAASIDMKLAVPIKSKEKPEEEKSVQTEEEKETEQDLGKDMVAAVKKVAETIEGSPEVVESELVQKLKTQVGKKINLSNLFAGMKIDRSSKASSSSVEDMELSRAHRVRRLLDERTKESKRTRDSTGTPQVSRQRRVPVAKPTYIPIDLFGAPPLGIFSEKKETKSTNAVQQDTTPLLKTWDLLSARDLKLSITHPPANGFEEMILWTEQGKLWKFPIDNEQGLDEEAKVPFHEHVFLEPQIEGWCPKKGPIRHFMELVCVGLSKNPFLTVKEKHEQIEWYHQYFKEKASIIREVGAGEIK